MKRLKDIGFEKVGEWINEKAIFKYAIVKNNLHRNLLYAFIVDGKIFYIGKTTDTLENRMNGYKNASGTQKTNIRVKEKILEQLNQSKSVEIHILLDEANLKYGNYQISLASGLEDNLIIEIQPEWNFRGKIRIKEQELPAEDENTIIEILPQIVNTIQTVEIKLGNTYWNNGYFNFSKKHLHLLPSKVSQVTLLLGESDDFFTIGKFHFGTKENQPRVQGSKSLKEWFQQNFLIGNKITVDILKKDLFRIR